MIPSDRMAAVDRNAAALGVPRKQLMESSGNAVARAVRRVADPGAAVAVVAGRGNNGGDGLVATRFLDDYVTTVHLLGRPETIRTRITRENWDALRAGEYDTRTVTDAAAVDLGNPDVVVDAMLGTGVTGGLREPEATAANAVNRADATVVSVDVPSGVNADTGEVAGVAVDADSGKGAGVAVDADSGRGAGAAVDADRVVTFHDRKPGLDAVDAEVTVADIGIPAAAERFVGPGDLLGLDRAPDSHKGDAGEVLVVGGGPYTGAPALAGQAALRAGADLVRIACPTVVADTVQGYSESLILRPYDGERFAPDHVDEVLETAARHDTVVIGPGLGRHDETRSAVRKFLTRYDGTAVVDADALAVVPEVDTDATLLCTPHQGELRGMGGETATDWRTRTELVAEFAAELGHLLLVKGPYDVVSDGDETRVNRTGNPGMTVGGTGDVLAGATGALACVLPPLHAASVAAYATGRAGDAAAETAGDGLVATDLPDRLPAALRDPEGGE